MSEKIIELEKGLELWKAKVEDLREQDLNARIMTNEMFERLTANIKNEKRLESLPFCALTDDGIEIISGHHRVRAAKSAGIGDIYILIDVTNLPEDKIKAKQLAHNSIQGEDDRQIVEMIYKSIQDANAKLEAFIDMSMDYKIDDIKLENMSLTFDYKNINLTFLPMEYEYFLKVLDELHKANNEIYVADIKIFEDFKKRLNEIREGYEIHSVNTAIMKMIEITGKELNLQPPTESSIISLKDLIKTTYISKEGGDKLKKAISKLKKEKKITDKDLNKAIELLAEEYINADEV